MMQSLLAWHRVWLGARLFVSLAYGIDARLSLSLAHGVVDREKMMRRGAHICQYLKNPNTIKMDDQIQI